MEPAVAELIEAPEVGRRLRLRNGRLVEGLKSATRGRWGTAIREAVGRLGSGRKRDKERV